MADTVDTGPAPIPDAPPAADDLALLRRFEPILRFTRGEELYPTDVDWYVRQSSLWLSHADGRREMLAGEGDLDLDLLGEQRTVERGAMLHLTFSDPLNLAQLSAFLLEEEVRQIRDPRNRFRADVARLARVGYASRLLDAIFSLTLFLRGRVPGDSAAAAIIACRRRPEAERIYPYYGRVVREGGWIVLQYWIFYPFNNWRSGFFGANDHEADWEMIAVYLYERSDGEVAPAWVAYASHDFHGDDLRRAWDDLEELERDGEHPIVYVGAGSHAAYFRRGEYVTEIEVPYLHRLASPIRRLAGVLAPDATPGRPGRRRAALGAVQDPVRRLRPRGRQRHRARPPPRLVAGPDRAQPDLDHPVPGPLGLLRPRSSGRRERASGPMYNRDGTVRRAWYDPVGWAGLDDVTPPDRETTVVQSTIDDLEWRQSELDHAIANDARELEALGAEITAVRGQHHLHGRLTNLEARVQAARAEAYARRRERAQNEVLLEALAARLARLQERPRAP